jgi:hypothetical protein
MDIHSQLFCIEREVTKIKTLYMLGSVSYWSAKERIIELDAQIKHLLSQLPRSERELYMFKKEIQPIA